jgi:DMSO/TMAO reductase YedYZ molybdopterin-dependent catalytic subunit
MERVKRYRVWIVVFLVTMLLLMALWIGVYLQIQPKNLYPTEIRNYQGENLSSISNVIENNIAGTQYINVSTYKLTITGLVNKTIQYSYDDVLNTFQKYQKVVTIHCIEGWTATILWEGFLVTDLLQQAGIKSSAAAAIFYAADNYSTALPLSYLTSKNIMIAYKMNNLTIPPERGFPFQLVAESQYGYKWIKWLTKIELTDNVSYLGYWESRGFANNATIP